MIFDPKKKFIILTKKKLIIYTLDFLFPLSSLEDNTFGSSDMMISIASISSRTNEYNERKANENCLPS
jgi:hypothetical protein